MSSVGPADPDTEKVLEIMRGASRSPRDPDIELATIISELADTTEADPYETVLARLVRDAHSD